MLKSIARTGSISICKEQDIYVYIKKKKKKSIILTVMQPQISSNTYYKESWKLGKLNWFIGHSEWDTIQVLNNIKISGGTIKSHSYYYYHFKL